MMQTVAVLALVLGLILLFRRLGPSVRRLPGEEKRSAKRHPEEDVPPPTLM